MKSLYTRIHLYLFKHCVVRLYEIGDRVVSIHVTLVPSPTSLESDVLYYSLTRMTIALFPLISCRREQIYS